MGALQAIVDYLRIVVGGRVLILVLVFRNDNDIDLLLEEVTLDEDVLLDLAW